MSEESLPLKAFARAVGMTPVTIRKYCNNGILPRHADGRIPVKAGMDALAEYTRAQGRVIMPRPVPAPKPKPAPEPEEGPGADVIKLPPSKVARKRRAQERVEEFIDGAADGLDRTVSVTDALAKAKLAEKTYQAKLKKLDFQVRNGELLDKDKVAQEAQALAEKIRGRLLAIPPRLAGQCEGRSARDIEDLLADGINEALKDLQRLKYESGGES